MKAYFTDNESEMRFLHSSKFEKHIKSQTVVTYYVMFTNGGYCIVDPNKKTCEYKYLKRFKRMKLPEAFLVQEETYTNPKSKAQTYIYTISSSTKIFYGIITQEDNLPIRRQLTTGTIKKSLVNVIYNEVNKQI